MTLTPMLQQYMDLKSTCEDAILFFRLGDFYEMFFDDAYKASRVLGITLTSRGKDKDGQKIPMCGVPHHAANNYIPKLLKNNIKVALCEQTENATESKGITKREIVKIITPGTILEDNFLPADDENNYLLVITKGTTNGNYGVAFADISTGEFYVTEISSYNELLDELYRLDPNEILLTTECRNLVLPKDYYTQYLERLSINESKTIVQNFYSIKFLGMLGIENSTCAIVAVAEIIRYFQKNIRSNVSLNKPKYYLNSQYQYLNNTTLEHLEIFKSFATNEKQGSLLWVLDKTKTAMGSRLLKKWLSRPLYNLDQINDRLTIVDYFCSEFSVLAGIENILNNVYDLERLLVRVKNNLIHPKDLIAIKTSLMNLPEYHQLLIAAPQIVQQYVLFPDEWVPKIIELSTEIENCIVEDPPTVISNGGIIKSNYSDELDKLHQEVRQGRQWLTELENKLRTETGIKSLRISYNKVFGYYIDVTKSNLHLVPDYFIRKQTLANSERFYTEELKEKENFILHADEIMIKKEIEIFQQLIEKIKANMYILTALTEKISYLDVITSLARVSKKYRYVKPEFNNKGFLELAECRHPVVEQNVDQFITNDLHLDDKQNFVILTGPNMAGKSTFMRQIALVIIMAHIGSFVPANAANIPLTDNVFARIGASDNLFAGKSTFMVEMEETANILLNATNKSFIILDEIGRGTSTFDGLSIAASVSKYIEEQIDAKTIFATHYHEMTSLVDSHKKMVNMNIAVYEDKKTVRFLYKVLLGKAEKSYGIHVGELAGLPKKVTETAKGILEHLEKENISIDKRSSPFKQMSLF